MAKNGNIHGGHRSRVRDELRASGLNEATPPHKVIEYILYHSIPQKDTNVIAHELISRFGSISGILDAPTESLMQVPGISKVSVSLLKLIVPVARIYSSEKSSSEQCFNDTESIARYIIGRYFGYGNEVFSMLSLSASGRLLGFDTLSNGEVNQVVVSVRQVVETAIKRNAVRVVIAHNHPGGVALPSPEDIRMTEMISNTLRHINIRVDDHIIITDDDYVSMSQSRCFKYIFEPESKAAQLNE